jgi:hypothetical protein
VGESVRVHREQRGSEECDKHRDLMPLRIHTKEDHLRAKDIVVPSSLILTHFNFMFLFWSHPKHSCTSKSKYIKLKLSEIQSFDRITKPCHSLS